MGATDLDTVGLGLNMDPVNGVVSRCAPKMPCFIVIPKWQFLNGGHKLSQSPRDEHTEEQHQRMDRPAQTRPPDRSNHQSEPPEGSLGLQVDDHVQSLCM